jgi:hypothetical protein
MRFQQTSLTSLVPQDTWGRNLAFLVLLVLGWYGLRLSADFILLEFGIGIGFS